MLETGVAVAVVVLVQLVATPTARAQETVESAQHQPSQDLYSPMPAVVVAEVDPIAILQRRVELVVTAVAETARRRPTPLRRVSH